MENLIKQIFESKKFKNHFGTIEDSELISSVVVKLFHYIQEKQIIRIEENAIEHDERNFSENQELFSSLYGST